MVLISWISLDLFCSVLDDGLCSFLHECNARVQLFFSRFAQLTIFLTGFQYRISNGYEGASIHHVNTFQITYGSDEKKVDGVGDFLAIEDGSILCTMKLC
mmetsp:Transcript_13720/g.20963  ORF Transcript_13720/g.20963 Transcript_13720/m.20963 type:complete len:100 (-) Transcript_13720:38-337(-)